MFARPETRGGRVLVEPISATEWRLEEELRYIGERDEFVIPAGYVTDFATVPRIAVWLIPRFGSFTKAAILHDWLLTNRLGDGTVTSVDVDNLFRRALRELDVPPWRRTLMWTGVRWGALFNRERRAGWLSTAPAVLGHSLVFLLSIVPPVAMLVVALALVVYAVFEFVASTWSRDDMPTGGSLST